jgi:hypothetical protein
MRVPTVNIYIMPLCEIFNKNQDTVFTSLNMEALKRVQESSAWV